MALNERMLTDGTDVLNFKHLIFHRLGVFRYLIVFYLETSKYKQCYWNLQLDFRQDATAVRPPLGWSMLRIFMLAGSARHTATRGFGVPNAYILLT